MDAELQLHLMEMGILPKTPKPKKPDVVWPKEKPVYTYNDPRDPITGEVPF